MTANPATTATVELLTAEVRTVMIGRRQVTLGVWRQLDWVPPDKIEPFGRVRDAHDDPGYGIYVVGRNPSDGALVRSLLRPPPPYVDQGIPAALQEEQLFRMRNAHAGPGVVVVGRNSGVAVHWPTLPSPLRLVDPTVDYGEWSWASEEVRRQADPYIVAALRELVAQHAHFQAWKSLPLIVLAGLR